ncbi:MAG: single-stranded DNA-binding protein, partial [Bacilli bacterium]|nr:single-stranded DNA-binding protein [Bacilli bacterium]
KTAIVVAVQRPFKNPDGLYETDFIRCVLWNSVATNTSEYCKGGDIIGVKGRIQTGSYEDDEKNRRYITEVIAERVSFLSNKRVEEDMKEITCIEE